MQQQLSAMQVQLAKFDEETKRLRVMLDSENKAEALELRSTTEADKQSLEEKKFEHDKIVDYAEIAIEAKQERPTYIG